jgi:hypothetical protein
MTTWLNFPIQHHFKTTVSGIVIPCQLEQNGVQAGFEAKVDSGAEFCLFTREIAEELEIDVADGYGIRLDTLAGGLTAYAHAVTLHTLGLSFESLVLFHPAYGSRRNLLGRNGWLNNLHLALTMDDDMIYLNPIASNKNL